MLQDKITLVFAATGAIAGEVGRSFARHGAVVHASGRDADGLERLHHAITEAGGRAETAVVDATDDRAVADHVRDVGKSEGRVDAVFNGIGARPAELRYPAVSATVTLEDFLLPQERILWSTFLTTRAAAGVMAQRGGGSIVTGCGGMSAGSRPSTAAVPAIASWMVLVSGMASPRTQLTRTPGAELGGQRAAHRLDPAAGRGQRRHQRDRRPKDAAGPADRRGRDGRDERPASARAVGG